jgi:DNA-binding NarL/FixJ family response regulator
VRGNGEKTAVVLDRHPLWLDALERLLDRVGVTVVGRTTSTEAAVQMVEEFRPSLVIAEYEAFGQPEERQIALRQATKAGPDSQYVILSTTDGAAQIEAAFAAGASVFCVKTAESDDLASAIRQAFGSSIYYAGTRPALAEVPPAALSGLTKREVEILRLVAEGHSNSQLAKMLWVTEQTVKFHLSNIYRKLDVANRTEASRWAQLNGLLSAVSETRTAAA